MSMLTQTLNPLRVLGGMMLEVNVNRLVTTLDASDISASVAEKGPSAGPETWRNAKAGALRLLKPEQRDAARAWAKEFGAWSADEIARWTATEVDALVLQYAAGDLRELQALAPGDGVGDIDWAVADALSEAGTCGGNLFVNGKELWISLS